MRRPLQTLLLAGLLLAAAGAHKAEGEPDAGPVEVSVSVPPLAYFVSRVGGEHVRTHVLIPPGATPETHAPKPSELERIARSDVYVLVGHPGVEMERTHIRNHLEAHPEIRVIDMYQVSGASADPEASRLDPHIWLSPALVVPTVHSLATTLSALDPRHADEYSTGSRSLLLEIEQLDEEIRSDLLPPRNDQHPRRILVAHPAWGWFARHYGVRQLAIEHEGKEAGPRELISLIERARAAEVRRVFVQRGFSSERARTVAREIGAELTQVDPLAHDWTRNLREVARLFGEASAPRTATGDSR